jgi:hypothetical protein
MKPIITAVTSDRGGVVGASQPQTLYVNGTGLGPDTILVFEGGAIPTQVLRPPTVKPDKAGVIATVNVPVPVTGSPSNPTGRVWAVSGDMVSDELDFPVGKG